MARTPLLRALQRLAAEHRAASELGIPPAELRGRRDDALSRRELLKRAGVAGAAVAVAGPAAFAQRAGAATAPRIAIVGGGIAGLSAALTLADGGYAATIYEASTERIGGRMHSDRSGYWANGQVSEFCGELIDTGHTTIRGLAKRFNLATVDLLAAQPRGSSDTYYFLGGDYPVAQADSDFQPVAAVLKSQLKAAGYPTTYASSTQAGRDLDHLTVYDWIERYVPGGHGSRLGRLLDAAYNEEYGAETTEQASLNLVYLLAYQPTGQSFEIFGASDERFHIAGGNERLPDAIAAYVGGQSIKLGWSMQSIRANSDGTVTMSFATPGKTQTVTADHVILSLPFAVLRNLDYAGAGFDARKVTAITQLGAGRNSKLQLQFASRYWNAQGSTGGVYTDIGIQNAWDVTRGQNGATGILNNYSGGNVAGGYAPSTPYSNAASSQQVTNYAKAFLKKIELVFPGISAQWNGKATLSTPFRDPLLNCSYSYWKTGQYTQFSGYEKVAQGRIHFAGEHCSQDFQGYMEGGASEGVRAANEILALV
ncbi:MAG TPA: NAD(P)/FAD-dependent oxidoreductase [Gaiellaceae bacterium]|nr:NAD(P)/FAD-dependent oxidoreductase [Gaiellaceae bacterium]